MPKRRPAPPPIEPREFRSADEVDSGSRGVRAQSGNSNALMWQRWFTTIQVPTTLSRAACAGASERCSMRTHSSSTSTSTFGFAGRRP